MDAVLHKNSQILVACSMETVETKDDSIIVEPELFSHPFSQPGSHWETRSSYCRTRPAGAPVSSCFYCNSSDIRRREGRITHLAL